MTKNKPFTQQEYPALPGVYMMKGEDGTILYVGKARNLRSRLRAYLHPERDNRPQIRFLMEKAWTIETIITDTEKEALILENTLIKEHRPRYNIDLRDDKTYVSLRIDLREDYPGLRIVRQVKEDGALYLGPYASSVAVKETLKELYRIFPLRRLSKEFCARRRRPCLYFQIGQCSGPCHGRISRGEYAVLVRGAIDLLSGRQDAALKLLQQQMQSAASAFEFEKAAQIRDRIAAIKATVERQKMVTHGGGDVDVFGLWSSGGRHAIVVLNVRQGRLVGRHNYQFESDMAEAELLGVAVQQFYSRSHVPPSVILLPSHCDESALLGEWLAGERGGAVKIISPLQGEKRKLVDLAVENARDCFNQEMVGESGAKLLEEIAARLSLQRIPERIECFDISNLQGTNVVGSMAVLMGGLPAKKEYRRYEVRSLEGHADDYAALYEVLTRRFARARQEGAFPDLILIDGGRGQLAVAMRVLDEQGVAAQVRIASIAKARRRRDGTNEVVRSLDRFFLPGRTLPIFFPAGSAALRMLQRLRDEAHRFAVTYHRQRRGEGLLVSQLESISGVGGKTRLSLLRHFGSMRGLRMASEEEIAQIRGIGMNLAKRIYAGIHPAVKDQQGGPEEE